MSGQRRFGTYTPDDLVAMAEHLLAGARDLAAQHPHCELRRNDLRNLAIIEDDAFIGYVDWYQGVELRGETP